MLKNSARNSRCLCSLMANCLTSEVSQVLYPGPLISLRGALPNVPWAVLGANAQVLNSVPGTQGLALGLPTTLGVSNSSQPCRRNRHWRRRFDVSRSVVIASGGRKDASHLPVTKNLVHHAGSSFAKRTSATERQVVDIAENEAVAHVKVGVAVVLVGEALVLEIPVVHRSQAGAGSIVEGVRESVRGFVLQSVRVALLQANLQRVVVRLRVRPERVDGSYRARDCSCRAWRVVVGSSTARNRRWPWPVTCGPGAAAPWDPMDSARERPDCRCRKRTVSIRESLHRKLQERCRPAIGTRDRRCHCCV